MCFDENDEKLESGESARKWNRIVPWLGILIGIAAFVIMAREIDPQLDDAYISYRYAENFALGNGLVYNEGELVEGYTNFLWTVFLGGLHFLGFGIISTARIAGAAFGALTILLVGLRAIRKGDVWAAWPAPILLGCNATFAFHAPSGMEMGMFLFFITLGAWRMEIERLEEKNLPLAGLFFALAALTRPEGILIFGLCLLAFNPFGAIRNRRKWLFGTLAVFVLIVGTHFLWRHAYYGLWFPNTYYAKVGWSKAQAWRGLVYTVNCIRNAGFVGVALAASLLLRRPFKDYRFAFPLVVVGWLVYMVLVGGDIIGMFRFALPAFPFVAMLAGDLFHKRRDETTSPLLISRTGAVFAALFIIIPGAFFPLMTSEFHGARIHTKVEIPRWRMVGRLIEKATPETSVIGVGPAGALPFYARRKTYDFLGLTVPEIAHKRTMLGSGVSGHEKFDERIILDKRPDYLFLRNIDVRTTGVYYQSRSNLPWESRLLNSVSMRLKYVEATVKLSPVSVLVYYHRKDAPPIKNFNEID